MRLTFFSDTGHSIRSLAIPLRAVSTRPLGPILFILMGFNGCTSLELRRSTLAAGKTLTDLQYGIVLDNLAMFKEFPKTPCTHSTCKGVVSGCSICYSVADEVD
jgi:hypothetical protein